MTWLYNGFVTRLTRRVSLVEQELLTLPEHQSSPPVFSGVRVSRSLVLYVCFVDRCLSFCTFSFGHCVVCSSSIYGFWLPLWYLQSPLDFGFCLSNCFVNDLKGEVIVCLGKPFVNDLKGELIVCLGNLCVNDLKGEVIVRFVDIDGISDFFICMFCWLLSFLLYFFFWSLCCVFFDIRILIAPLVSSNSS